MKGLRLKWQKWEITNSVIWVTVGVGRFIWAFLFSGFWTQELFTDFQELCAEFQELYPTNLKIPSFVLRPVHFETHIILRPTSWYLTFGGWDFMPTFQTRIPWVLCLLFWSRSSHIQQQTATFCRCISRVSSQNVLNFDCLKPRCKVAPIADYWLNLSKFHAMKSSAPNLGSGFKIVSTYTVHVHIYVRPLLSIRL